MSTGRAGAKSSVSVVGLKNRPRRAIQSIDTNLSSYDKTDPFHAINVLRKISGALPSSQYKMSPEEHKLFIHLLAIVEPFVGLPLPLRGTITKQPTEILDAIVFHVDSKRDLLSLGLTCRRLHDVVFPRHWEYRLVRCKVSAIGVWNHLISNRCLARNVRRLEIIDERSSEMQIIPSFIADAATHDLESADEELRIHVQQERSLVSALTQMTALQRFSWSCNHSPISIDNVWPTLLDCQSLKEVEINDNLVFSPLNDNEWEYGSQSPHMLHELKTVALRSTKHSYGATKFPELSRISGILSQCPNLESLDIGYNHRRGMGCLNPTADEFFLCGRWPYLTSLSLTNLRCTAPDGLEAAAAFLHAHVNVEVLHLELGPTGSFRSRLVLPADTLPRLRELRSNKEFATAILSCPCDPPRPLETIKGVALSGSSWDQTFLNELKKYGTRVKRLELTSWNDMDDIKRLVECAPKLTWLDVGRHASSGISMGAKGGPIMHTNAVQWAMILENLPDLTALHGVRFFYDVSTVDPHTPVGVSDRSRVRKNDEIAAVLAWGCPKLRRLDHWEEGSGKVIVLLRDPTKELRDGDKVKYEVRRVKS